MIHLKNLKGTSTDIWKTVFRKVLFMWSSMPIFSFIGYTLTELFRKPDNWRQIYKQTGSTFYTSNDVSSRKNCQQIITRLQNSCLLFLKKYRSSHQRGSVRKMFLKISQTLRKNICVGGFFDKVATLQPASFLKRDSNSSAFLWSFQNF